MKFNGNENKFKETNVLIDTMKIKRQIRFFISLKNICKESQRKIFIRFSSGPKIFEYVFAKINLFF